ALRVAAADHVHGGGGALPDDLGCAAGGVERHRAPRAHRRATAVREPALVRAQGAPGDHRPARHRLLPRPALLRHRHGGARRTHVHHDLRVFQDRAVRRGPGIRGTGGPAAHAGRHSRPGAHVAPSRRGHLPVIAVVVVFLVLLTLGMPIGYVLGIAGMVGMFTIDTGGRFLTMAPDRFFAGLDLFTFLAMPFFILAGEIMNRSGITDRLIGLADALVGYL